MIEKKELTIMITAIEDIQKNIQDVFQKVLLQYYLQPMNGVEKKELRDGYIERTIHGAMHATRAALYVDTLHQLHKKYYPSETQKTLFLFKEKFGIDEKHLIILTELAVLFHDSARKGEGHDIWETESAQNLVDFLKEKRIDSKLIHLFQYALIDKDNPATFITRFNQEKTSELSAAIKKECIDAYDYIRQLIQGADCLEIIRCVKHFKFDYLHFYKNSQSQPYKESLKTCGVNIHELLYIHGDLLYDCELFAEGEPIQTLHQGSRHVLAKKVALEHSINIYYSILLSFDGINYFKTIRSTELVKCRLEHPELAYNPYIHGTNSSIFILLPKTEYRFFSPIQMMEQYQIAPMSGEIWGGGLAEAIYDGRMCFGRLDTALNDKDEHSRNLYGKNKIINSYSKIRFSEPDVASLKKSFTSCISNNFQNINTLMIDLTRAKLCGIELSTVIPEIQNIKEQITHALEYYDFIIFILTYLSVNVHELTDVAENIKDIEPNKCIWRMLDAFRTYYKFDAIRNRIAKNGLDLKNILQNPTKANIECLASVLSFPLCNVLEDETLNAPNVPKVVNFFTPLINNPIPNNKINVNSVIVQTNFSLLRDEGITGLLKKITNTVYDNDVYLEWKNLFPAIKENMLKHIECLKRRFESLLAILEKDINQMRFTAIEQSLVRAPFPVILASESEEQIELLDIRTMEYRAKSSLTLGNDISVLATDSLEHKSIIEAWLSSHGFDNVSVVLFEELSLKQKPNAPQRSVALLFHQNTCLSDKAKDIVLGYLYQEQPRPQPLAAVELRWMQYALQKPSITVADNSKVKSIKNRKQPEVSFVSFR